MQCDDESRASLIGQFNAAVATQGATEWVMVRSLRTSGGGESENYSSGRLHRILDRRLSERYVLDYLPAGDDSDGLGAGKGSRGGARISDVTLVDLWRSAGHSYSAEDAQSILQVIIEFAHLGGGGAGGSRYFTYPADQVFRDQADVTPPSAEVHEINASLQGEWILDESQRAREHSHSVVPLSSAAEATMQLYETIQVRDGFVASEGYVFVAADYCQIELRILAHFCADDSLCAAFKHVASSSFEAHDVFKAIAARWRNKSHFEVTVAERNQVKQICYALIYGAGPALVAQQADITEDAARAMMTDFLVSYPGIKQFVTRVKNSCRRTGGVETLLGRRRVLSDIHSKQQKVRSRAERQAVNTICQGSAADLIKVLSFIE